MRLTPLNIISSLLLVGSAYVLTGRNDQLEFMPLLALLILSFVSDLLFRRLVRDIKRIWLFELLFIIFVGMLILLIRTQFN
jgi:hypothetical protein